MRRPLPALLLAAACAAASCAGDDAARDDGAVGPLRAAEPAPRTVEWRGSAGEAPPTIGTFPDETQAFMKESLHLFSAQDPRWEPARARWLAMGPRESRFLVQLLWGAVLAGQRANAPEIVERARHELALVGAPSVPLLAAVLSVGDVGTAYDPATGEETTVPVDDLQRREAAQALALVGAPAVPAVLDALRNAQSTSGRRHALLCLGEMGERGGADAAAALSAWSASDDLPLAVEAVVGMRNLRDAVTRQALLDRLRSDEPLVREKAAASCVSRRDASVVPDLVAAAERARADGKLLEAKRLERCASTLSRLAAEGTGGEGGDRPGDE